MAKLAIRLRGLPKTWEYFVGLCDYALEDSITNRLPNGYPPVN